MNESKTPFVRSSWLLLPLLVGLTAFIFMITTLTETAAATQPHLLVQPSGDYVLLGGELPAMVMMEAICRLLPGTVGDPESVRSDSITSGRLKYPQYTRPAEFQGHKVPDVLLSGNHEEIRIWREKKSDFKTLQKRPNLLQLPDPKKGT